MQLLSVHQTALKNQINNMQQCSQRYLSFYDCNREMIHQNVQNNQRVWEELIRLQNTHTNHWQTLFFISIYSFTSLGITQPIVTNILKVKSTSSVQKSAPLKIPHIAECADVYKQYYPGGKVCFLCERPKFADPANPSGKLKACSQC